MALTTLLLDLDGTLVDGSEVIVEGVLELAAEAGLPVPDPGWARGRIGFAPDETWRLLGAEDPAALVDAFTARVVPRLAEGCRLLPGVEPALAELAGLGLSLAVATTRLTDSARASLACHGLDRHVTHVTGRDLVARAKPAPDVLLHALEAVGGEVGAALMIGDSAADVLAATAAGMPCWAVAGGSAPADALREAGAARILDGGLGDLPAALRSAGLLA